MPDCGLMCYYFDTVTLSNFALVDSMDLLVARYGRQLLVTHEVRTEIDDGISSGFDALSVVDDLIYAGKILLAPPMDTKEERKLYLECLRTLSAGEASCIVCAASREGTVVTDDYAARKHCQENGIAVTGTIGILQRLIQEGLISLDQANEKLEAMIAAGFYSPISSFKDIL